MSKKNLITIVILFTVLTVTGVCLIVFGPTATQPEAQRVLPLIGVALFASSLTFFLVSMVGGYREEK